MDGLAFGRGLALEPVEVVHERGQLLVAQLVQTPEAQTGAPLVELDGAWIVAEVLDRAGRPGGALAEEAFGEHVAQSVGDVLAGRGGDPPPLFGPGEVGARLGDPADVRHRVIGRLELRSAGSHPVEAGVAGIGATGHRGEDSDLVPRADDGVVGDGVTVDPDATRRQHVGEARAVALDGSGEDVGDGVAGQLVTARAGRLAGGGEQTNDGHRSIVRVPGGSPAAPTACGLDGRPGAWHTHRYRSGLVATDKRERQRANRQLKYQALVKEQRRETTKRRALTYGLGVVGLFVLVLALAALGGAFSDDEETLPSISPSTVPAAEETPCPEADGSSPRRDSFAQAPPMCIDPEASYTAEVVTNVGDLTIELDAEAAPNTVNNFVVLARYHYFDGTPCHRAITGFMVQCGDPTGTGTGGPGYEFANENPADNADYGLGAVAMANSGPDTNGSQFFITTSDSSPSLATDYSLFGQVTEGLDTTLPALDALGSNPDAQDGVPPSEEIVIESVTITETGADDASGEATGTTTDASTDATTGETTATSSEVTTADGSGTTTEG